MHSENGEKEREGEYNAHPSLLYGQSQHVTDPELRITTYGEYVLLDANKINPTHTAKWMLQMLEVEDPNNNRVAIGNVRGLWQDSHKNDTPERSMQTTQYSACLVGGGHL